MPCRACFRLGCRDQRLRAQQLTINLPAVYLSECDPMRSLCMRLQRRIRASEWSGSALAADQQVAGRATNRQLNKFAKPSTLGRHLCAPLGGAGSEGAHFLATAQLAAALEAAARPHMRTSASPGHCDRGGQRGELARREHCKNDTRASHS